MKKRMMLIINPMAGRSGYKTGSGEVMNILDSGGYLTTVYFTQGRGDATVFAAQHAVEYDTVACIGGDGTLSEVVSGLMQVPNPPRWAISRWARRTMWPRRSACRKTRRTRPCAS